MVEVKDSKKVWATLITNTKYLPGLFTLDYSLKKHGSKYPLVAVYTNSFPKEGHKALDSRNIPKKQVNYLLPSVHKDYTDDPRFYDTWSKLTLFSLIEYDRVVQLDSDMLVLKNMDELMDLELDSPSTNGLGNKVFAASHACCCNPLKKPHYPKDWITENCAFTTQHADPDAAQTKGAPPRSGLGILNSGLLVINPSSVVYDAILERMKNPSAVENYQFPDQDLLADVFEGRWVPLPYVYNALKTLRWKEVHDLIWRDQEVKNVHYILSPKPWDEKAGDEKPGDETHKWWWASNAERKTAERSAGVNDGF